MTGREDYLRGRYDVCRLLLTSPCMNSTQSEVIRDLAIEAEGELERLRNMSKRECCGNALFPMITGPCRNCPLFKQNSNRRSWKGRK